MWRPVVQSFRRQNRWVRSAMEYPHPCPTVYPSVALSSAHLNLSSSITYQYNTVSHCRICATGVCACLGTASPLSSRDYVCEMRRCKHRWLGEREEMGGTERIMERHVPVHTSRARIFAFSKAAESLPDLSTVQYTGNNHNRPPSFCHLSCPLG